MEYVRGIDCYNIMKEEMMEMVDYYLYDMDIDVKTKEEDNRFVMFVGDVKNSIGIEYKDDELYMIDGKRRYKYPKSEHGDFDVCDDVMEKFLHPFYRCLLDAIYVKYNKVIAYNDEFDTYPELQVGDTQGMDVSEECVGKVTSTIKELNSRDFAKIRR